MTLNQLEAINRYLYMKGFPNNVTKMKNKKLIYGIIFGLILTALMIMSCTKQKITKITNFEECAKAGYPVGESYPRQCFAQGKTFVEEVTTKTSTIEPQDPEKTGLYNYSDYPLESIPITSISVKYLVEHRSALNEKVVVVRGVVVSTLLGEKACPRDIGGFGVLMCAQPRIFLADIMNENRDPLYDLMVIVGEEEKDYKIGETITIKVLVYGDKTSVNAVKTD